MQDLETSLPLVRERLVEEQMRAVQDSARREFEEASLCTVCVERHRDCVLNCGHLLCKQCAHSVDTCPHCRMVVKSRRRAFV
jgi:hypothetical protein